MNEYEEAAGIAGDIHNDIRENGSSCSDFAVLYRTNAQSRVFEEKLVQENIPYRIVGAINFYSRKEIKDLLCYLKTIHNPEDDIAVRRIINVPRRGIGATTIQRVTDYSLDRASVFLPPCGKPIISTDAAALLPGSMILSALSIC